MSIAFMKDVIEGKMWLPPIRDIRLLNCASVPPKHILAAELHTRMMNLASQGEPFDTIFRHTALRVRQNPPVSYWMLAILSTIDPENAFFRKDYVKPKTNPV